MRYVIFVILMVNSVVSFAGEKYTYINFIGTSNQYSFNNESVNGFSMGIGHTTKYGFGGELAVVKFGNIYSTNYEFTAAAIQMTFHYMFDFTKNFHVGGLIGSNRDSYTETINGKSTTEDNKFWNKGMVYGARAVYNVGKYFNVVAQYTVSSSSLTREFDVSSIGIGISFSR